MTIMRIIDANTNRVCEGIRVVEDYYRFIRADKQYVNQLRQCRHQIRKNLPSTAINQRDSQNDIGLVVSSGSTLDQKSSIRALLAANFVRIQEGLRVLEEYYKVFGDYDFAKQLEQIRYRVYQWHKKLNHVLLSGVYAITKAGNKDSIISDVAMLLSAGVKIIQYRDKQHDYSQQITIAQTLRQLTNQHGALLIINDHLAVAQAVQADGIHIGQDDMTITQVRAQSKQLLIGVSTHNRKQFTDALALQPDYIALGPIFETTTKSDLSPCEGLDYAAWARLQTELPLVAIGGINSTNIKLLIDNKINACAMISALKDKATSEQLIKMYKEKN